MKEARLGNRDLPVIAGAQTETGYKLPLGRERERDQLEQMLRLEVNWQRTINKFWIIVSIKTT
jgi:hypothetical protein